MRAGDRAYAAEMLSEMSRMTLLIGQNALTEHDRLRHGRQAAALARAGLTIAQGTSTTGSPTSSPVPSADTSRTTTSDSWELPAIGIAGRPSRFASRVASYRGTAY